MSIWTAGLDDIYASDIGCDATLSVSPTEPIRAVDKTSGVDLQLLGLSNVPTIVPAACVQRTTLTAMGIEPADLIGTTITLNGATWRISNHAYRPQPGGELEGELFLLLRKA